MDTYSLLKVSTSTMEDNQKMKPWFFTGFSDGEACFMVYIQKPNSTKIKWISWVSFEINLSNKDLSIIKSIKFYLKVGTINQKSKGFCVYKE